MTASYVTSVVTNFAWVGCTDEDVEGTFECVDGTQIDVDSGKNVSPCTGVAKEGGYTRDDVLRVDFRVKQRVGDWSKPLLIPYQYHTRHLMCKKDHFDQRK